MFVKLCYEFLILGADVISYVPSVLNLIILIQILTFLQRDFAVRIIRVASHFRALDALV